MCVSEQNNINFNSKLHTRIDEGIVDLMCYFGVTLYSIWINIPQYLNNYSHTILTCSDQFNVSSNVVSRHLKMLIFMNSVVISEKLLRLGLSIVWKNMKFVLLAFIVNLLQVHHLFNSLNLFMISKVSVFKSEWRINGLSSANNLTSFCSTALYIINVNLKKITVQEQIPRGPHINPNTKYHIYINQLYSIQQNL